MKWNFTCQQLYYCHYILQSFKRRSIEISFVFLYPLITAAWHGAYIIVMVMQADQSFGKEFSTVHKHSIVMDINK